MTESSTPVRRINSFNEFSSWKSSPAYSDITKFIAQLNEFAKGSHEALSDLSLISYPPLLQLIQLLNDLDKVLTEVPAIEGDASQRFGNKAFRTWYDRMQQMVKDGVNSISPDYSDELDAYLLDAFGNRQRIDYGTGHELNFVIFLLGLYKLLLLPSPDGSESSVPSSKEEEVRDISRQLLSVFGFVYVPLVRKIQIQYKLEPAGSHGVYSLDDFQFLPFVWGSAQLVGHPKIEPASFPEKEVASLYAPQFMFHSSIAFIHEVKIGPFAEHSNQLWNISGIDDWGKINRGLLRMYTDEVLHKFPIVQHLLFGPRVFQWHAE